YAVLKSAQGAPCSASLSFVWPKESNQRKRHPVMSPYGFPALLVNNGAHPNSLTLKHGWA
ncbi:MAG: hypothetical protein OEX19_16955, partial [Gammaproteobacteria bacterium]|nr:hypothetical protein [Gammaproteobacteria bacterium]